jgi:hypothetical protein
MPPPPPNSVVVSAEPSPREAARRRVAASIVAISVATVCAKGRCNDLVATKTRDFTCWMADYK